MARPETMRPADAAVSSSESGSTTIVPTSRDVSRTALVRRARRIHRVLAETYPDARCELDFRSPFELLVATVLSAQTTDRRVNAVTPLIFERWPDATAMAGADRAELEDIVRPTGFFRAKSGHVLGLSAAIVERFDGQVPARLADLVTLPGVGRKTANVVLGNAFAVPGLAVDTHVLRLVERLAWVDAHTASDAVRTEHAVGALFPRRDWTMLSHRLIWHGRRRCHARTPACGACPVARWCPSFGLGPTEPDLAEALVTTQGRA